MKIMLEDLFLIETIFPYMRLRSLLYLSFYLSFYL